MPLCAEITSAVVKTFDTAVYVSRFSATPCLVTFCTSTSVPVALELLPNIV